MQKEITPIRIVKFWQEFRLGEDGQQIATDWVSWYPAGGRNYALQKEAVKRLSCLEPYEPDNIAIRFAHERWKVIEPQYVAWKEGREIPTDGTPLGVWAGVSQDQGEAFKNAGLITVEQIATASGSQLARIPLPNVQGLQRQAQAYLETVGDAAGAKRLKEQDDLIASMKEDQDELKKIIMEQQEELKKIAAAKPGNTKPANKKNQPAQATA